MKKIIQVLSVKLYFNKTLFYAKIFHITGAICLTNARASQLYKRHAIAKPGKRIQGDKPL